MTIEEAKNILEWGIPLDGDSDDRWNEYNEALSVVIETFEWACERLERIRDLRVKEIDEARGQQE